MFYINIPMYMYKIIIVEIKFMVTEYGWAK